MNALLRPLKYFVPFDGHPIKSLSFNSDRDASLFLCCSSHSQAKIFDRYTLKPKMSTVRGDMYISDMANTKGHIASITAGSFHPKDPNLFITSSLDSTLRQWDVRTPLYGMGEELP